MELNITTFFNNATPRDYSASVGELGHNAGAITWQAAKEAAPEYNFLDTDEKREEFRRYVKGFGAWNEAEIAAWDDTELNALLIQLIAGDIREVPDMNDASDWDWELYEQYAEEGRIGGLMCRSDDGQIYYYIGD